ncbi:MAG: (2Fe-2S)-binding protein [Myxococcota bacterium]
MPRFVSAMLVCHCKKVHCRTVRSAVRAGASDVDSVGRACGAGTGCGGCRPLVDALVAQERGGVRLGRGLPVANESAA